ncbi:nucleoside/nucleotide kinase family protein [Antiquaquibacter soli]|uniref:Nucleoside/nucleotide kinase family protein n=1 Tax=Antiquaquibacter soli TaxID=3064523 RepID=A0ABT9BPU0_9MICO|nr:nucleoside/nucleotide kinase family protein [Protaetiibacter sp. WY-16]MDO7883010.1 nucleoside/nucleotide kinase family protein [Protaetiibacter sp. WY-16]
MSRFESVEELVTHLSRPLERRRVVGIAGAPGAGKSTIAEAVARSIPTAALLPMDGYHYPQSVLRDLGRRDRMGAPDTFDVDAFVATLESVRVSDVAVLARGFDRTIEEPVPDAITIAPEKCTVIVEGNYLLLDSGGWERVAPLLDESFVIEVDDAVRIERLVARHIRFGKSEPDARAWALGPDESNARLIAATASRADHVIALDAGR